MTDFHTHILPGIDDGSDCIETSLDMLSQSTLQGVSTVIATPHFYADESNPFIFLRDRAAAFQTLKEAMDRHPGNYPKIKLGAEILFFPGMSVAEELADMSIEGTDLLLVEPPMMPWSDIMLDEIEQTGRNLSLTPVIAHLDRYMRYLRDNRLIDRLKGRQLLVQVNAGFFLHSGMSPLAMKMLKNGQVDFIGSDCHNCDYRPQNMGPAAEEIIRAGYSDYLERLNSRVTRLLGENE